jgi:hypothetical protein
MVRLGGSVAFDPEHVLAIHALTSQDNEQTVIILEDQRQIVIEGDEIAAAARRLIGTLPESIKPLV